RRSSHLLPFSQTSPPLLLLSSPLSPFFSQSTAAAPPSLLPLLFSLAPSPPLNLRRRFSSSLLCPLSLSPSSSPMEDPDGYNKSASAARAGEPPDVTIHLDKAALGGLESSAIPASYA
ncbi:unnamed protein product, partial [Urochloa humidicola]